MQKTDLLTPSGMQSIQDRIQKLHHVALTSTNVHIQQQCLMAEAVNKSIMQYILQHYVGKHQLNVDQMSYLAYLKEHHFNFEEKLNYTYTIGNCKVYDFKTVSLSGLVYIAVIYTDATRQQVKKVYHVDDLNLLDTEIDCRN